MWIWKWIVVMEKILKMKLIDSYLFKKVYVIIGV